MLMANAVAEVAALTAGKEARAMEAYANALRQLPSIIAENGGYDSAQLISELSALHKQGKQTMGLNMYKGCTGDMAELGISESLAVKRQVSSILYSISISTITEWMVFHAIPK